MSISTRLADTPSHLWLIAALLLLFLPRTGAAQVVTEDGGVISPETPVLRESLDLFHTTRVLEVAWTQRFVFSIDPTREFELELPILWKRVETRPAPPAPRQKERLFGPGDLKIRFKQSIWQSDVVMGSIRWAALVHLGIPTAPDDQRSRGGELPKSLQLGPGSWMVGGGTVFTLIRDRHRFSAEGVFRYHTRHDGFRPAPRLDLNLAYWFRVHPVAFDPDEETVEVRAVVELLSGYRFDNRRGSRLFRFDGITLFREAGSADDAGWIVWLAPGLQIYPSPSLLFEGNVRVPVYQNRDDRLGHRKLAATLALKLLF